MESIADKSMFYMDDPRDMAVTLPDPREAKYQLAERLVDNIRYGEALRILETLGDYRDSRALLEQVKALKAYQDVEESRLKAERRQQAAAREAQEAKDKKRRRALYIAAAVICLVLLVVLK